MKKTILAIMAGVFVAVCANAQQVVSGDTRNAKACTEYLSVNPCDTIREVFKHSHNGWRRSVIRSVYLNNNVLTARQDTVYHRQRVKSATVSVNETGQTQVHVTSSLYNREGITNDTVTWTVMNTQDIDFAMQESVCRGEMRVMDPEHKDFGGNFRHKVGVSLLSGGVLTKDHFAPVGTLRVGYETCHFLWELQGSISNSKYTSEAQYAGQTYFTFNSNFNVGWKFWQSRTYRSSVAILGSVGYGLQQTDGPDAVARSKNYGLIVGGMLRATLSPFRHKSMRHLSLVIEAGSELVPQVYPGQNQNMSHWGFKAQVGLKYCFHLPKAKNRWW